MRGLLHSCARGSIPGTPDGQGIRFAGAGRRRRSGLEPADPRQTRPPSGCGQAIATSAGPSDALSSLLERSRSAHPHRTGWRSPERLLDAGRFEEALESVPAKPTRPRSADRPMRGSGEGIGVADDSDLDRNPGWKSILQGWETGGAAQALGAGGRFEASSMSDCFPRSHRHSRRFSRNFDVLDRAFRPTRPSSLLNNSAWYSC